MMLKEPIDTASADSGAGVVPPVRWLARGRPGGQPMAFFHGLLESDALWRALRIHRLDPAAQAIGVPLPGHFPWTAAPETIAPLLHGDRLARVYADRLRAIFGRRPVRLVGHSAGALMALQVARVAPDLVRDLLVIAPVANPGGMAPPSVEARIAGLPVVGPIGVRWMLNWWLGDEARFARGLGSVVSGQADAGFLPMEMRSDLRLANAQSLRAFAIWLLSHDFAAGLTEVRAPVDAIICTEDPVVPAAHQMAILQALPHARAVMLHSGHLPMIERPDAFLGLFSHWLRAEERPPENNPE